MSISILSLEQFKVLITPTNLDNFLMSWRDNGDLFTGIVLAMTGSYNRQPKGKHYFCNGREEHSPEDWLEKLSKEEQIDALFKLNTWKNEEWGKEINVEDLYNLSYDFYRMANPNHELPFFKLDDRIFQVVEDEEDSYRSRMDKVVELNDVIYGFEDEVFTVVRVEEDPDNKNSDFVGYRIVDVNTSKVLVRFGTDNSEDYYPFFVFESENIEPKW